MSAYLTPLEGIDNSSRLLRTSIYLRNSLNQSDGNVQDLLDCVVPIVSDSIGQLPPGQIVLPDLQKVVQSRFSFKIPAFSLEHVLGRLAQSGRITYERDQKSYYHSGHSLSNNLAEEETVTDKISYLEQEMVNYAKTTFDIFEPLYFSTWADILVYFLHPDAVKASSSVKAVKGVLITDFDDIIRKIVSNFILNCEARADRKLFNIIIEVYGGILLGDFLQNIQLTGNPASFKSLTVFYDTSILLRLLGCSGSELRNANMEMHRDLQALGCKTEFLSHNENEVANILDTIVHRYDSHLSIFGETGKALYDADTSVNIGILRNLREGYPEALAALGVFPSKYTFQNTSTQNYYQIDEIKFEEMLKNESTQGYNEQNRINDASSIAVVMRLRQSSRSYDLANSKFILVTSNSHFARTARKFVRMELEFSSRYTPPVLTHAQISTAAWISKEDKLLDSLISRELLANCMSAQQLSREWVDGFVEIMKDASIQDEDHTIIHAIRSIARDESLGNPIVLRKLNPNEMIMRAKTAEEERTRTLKEAHEEELDRRLSESERTVRQEERDNIKKTNEHRAEKLAHKLVSCLEVLLVIPCVYVLYQGIGTFDANDYRTWFQPAAFVIVSGLAILDLFQFKPVKRITNPIRSKLTSLIYEAFYSE